MTQMSLFTKQNRLTGLENKLIVTGKDEGKRQGVWDGRVHRAVLKMDH